MIRHPRGGCCAGCRNLITLSRPRGAIVRPAKTTEYRVPVARFGLVFRADSHIHNHQRLAESVFHNVTRFVFRPGLLRSISRRRHPQDRVPPCIRFRAEVVKQTPQSHRTAHLAPPLSSVPAKDTATRRPNRIPVKSLYRISLLS